MDDRAVGIGIRASRVRRGWRQADLAAAARVSQTTVSRLERGMVECVPVGTVRAIANALGLGLEIRLRSRDGQVDRLVNSRHAALAEAVIAWILGSAGWVVRTELSFSLYGERGSIDLAAWHAESRTLLVIELKTEVVDVGELLATFDRKVRLAARVVAPLGWVPERIGAAVIVAGSATNRRAVSAHRSTFRSVLPDGIVSLRRWLGRPELAAPQALRALAFFSNSHHRNARSRFASIRRVRPATRPRPEHDPRTTGCSRGARAPSGAS